MAKLIQKIAEEVKKKKKKDPKLLEVYERIYGVEGPSTEYAKGRMEYNASPPLVAFSPAQNEKKWADNADKALDKKLRKEKNPYKAYGNIEQRTLFPGKLQSRHKAVKKNLEHSGVREDIIKARKVDPAKKLSETEMTLGFAALGAVGVLLATEMGLRASPEAAENFAKEIIAGGKTGLKTVSLSSAPLSLPGLVRPSAGEVTILKKPSFFNLLFGGPHYMPSDSMVNKLHAKVFGAEYSSLGHIVATPNLGVLSHELGHAKNRQWASKTFGAPGRIVQTMGYMEIGSLPIIGGRIPKPIRNLPLLGLAALPLFSEGFTKAMKGDDKESIRYKVFDKIEKNPEILGTALLFPKLIEEAAATGHGLVMVQKWGARKGGKGLIEVGKALASMLPAFATYALAAGGGYAALRALGKHRRTEGPKKMEKITRQHDRAMEKMKKLIK